MLIDGDANLIADDPWSYLDLPPEDSKDKTLPAAKIKAPTAIALSIWRDWQPDERVQFLQNQSPGLIIEGNLSYTELVEQLGDLSSIGTFKLIVVQVPVFTDGRVFSLIRRLREQASYGGEIRARGGYLTDQLHFLKRCGVDSFVLGDQDDLEDVKKLLSPFSHAYQQLPPD